jgi:dihydrodipicolinate synthase/N-acetylneuraminate lyase
MNTQKVTIVAPTPMPFTIKKELNLDALAKNTELWIKTKLDGFVIGTANGEESYVTQEEKYQATKIISEVSNNSKLIIGGIDSPSIYSTLNQIEEFHESGANHVRVRIPKSGNIVNYFEKILKESSLPVIMIHQNIGGREDSIKPKSNLAEPEEIGEICSMDNIVGYITDHSVRFEAVVRNHVSKNKYFWICNGSLIIHGVLIGANGACMAFANIGSAAAHKIFEYIKLNQLQEALDLQKRVTKIDYFVMKRGVVCLKAALEILGFELGLTRKPQSSLNKEDLRLLQEEIESIKPYII